MSFMSVFSGLFSGRSSLVPQMVNIAGGPFVMGSAIVDATYGDAAPHWVHVSPYSISATTVTAGQFRKVLGSDYGTLGAPKTDPATMVAHEFANRFIKRVNGKLGQRGRAIRLPTEAEWELAARGPAVNLYQAMETEGIGPHERVDRFAEFIRDRYENFVPAIEMGARIFTDPNDQDLRRILQNGQPLYGWHVFATPSGLPPDEAGSNRKGPAPADSGPVNGWGLRGLGNLLEWVSDWYAEDYYQHSPSQDPSGPPKNPSEDRVCRGAFWAVTGRDYLRVAFRGNEERHSDSGVPNMISFWPHCGFRVAAAPQDSGK